MAVPFEALVFLAAVYANCITIASSYPDVPRIPLHLLTKPISTSFSKTVEEKHPQMKDRWVNVEPRNGPVLLASLGERIEMECEAHGSPPPIMEWRRNDRKLFKMGFDQRFSTVGNIARLKSRYIIDCVMPHDQGVYKCDAIASGKSDTGSPATILIEGSNITDLIVNCDQAADRSPRIIVWAPIILQDDTNTEVILPCFAVGNPAPKIFWINNREEIVDETDTSHYLIKHGDLVIRKMTWDDMGHYTCVAQNSVGQDQAVTFLYPVKNDVKAMHNIL